MYSQCNEEQYLLDYFKVRSGKFLDIGAYDGKNLSNTRALFEKDWGGVCVEPSPSAFVKLHELYKDDDKVVLINEALGDKEGSSIFYEGSEEQKIRDTLGNMYSSLSAKHKKEWKGILFTEIEVQTTTWHGLLDRVGDDFDFINIDAEGYSFEIFQAMPLWRLNNLVCICIEHSYKFQTFIQFALEKGFRTFNITPENFLMFKDS